MVVPHPSTARFADAPRPHQVLVIANTIHTDLAIPVDPRSLATFAELAGTDLPIHHPDAQWLLFGWGGRSFYLETPTLADIRPGPLFRALTLDSSVMHVDVLGALDPNYPGVTTLALTDDAYSALLSAISQSFLRRDDAIVPIEGYSFGAVDRFYEANGLFNAFAGCNTWTARMLRSAGIATGLWNALPSSLETSLRWFNREALD